VSAWQFASFVSSACGQSVAGQVYIDIATQPILTLPVSEPDFSNPVMLDMAFTVPRVSVSGAPEAGTIGMGSVTIEATNEILETTDGTRIYDLVRGVAMSGPFDVDSHALHVRLFWRRSSAYAWQCRFWGIVDYSTITVDMGRLDDPDTWLVKFEANDCITQMEYVPTARFMLDKFTMDAYGKTAYAPWLTFIGTGTRTPPGRYLLTNIYHKNEYGYSYWLRYGLGDGLPISNLRFVRLVDIFTAVSEYCGFSGNVNDGAPWTARHTWQFHYNTGDSDFPGATDLYTVGLGEMWIIRGIDDPLGKFYAQTLFDPGGDSSVACPASLYNESTVYDLVKRVCISLGLTATVRVNASGERYLDIREAGMSSYVVSLGELYEYNGDANLEPYGSRITGVEVVSGPAGGNVQRGSTGKDSKKIDTTFTVANAMRGDAGLIAKAGSSSVVSGAYQAVVGADVAQDFWCSLWRLDGPAYSGMDYTDAWSICAIAPKSEGLGSSVVSSVQLIEGANGMYPLGVFRSVFGGITINAVQYPNTDYPVNTMCEVPAMALSHYLYSPDTKAVDDVGLYRRKGQRLTITRGRIEDELPYPGSVIEVEIGGYGYSYRVESVEEDYVKNEARYVCIYWGF
jgi:hypothetical protein